MKTETQNTLTGTILFCVGYAWLDQVFGELTGSTVVDACDEETALRRFLNQNRHIVRAWVIKGKAAS